MATALGLTETEDRAGSLQWPARLLASAAALLGGAAALLAVLVPYHLWDALSFGLWSRVIAEGDPLPADPNVASYYQRPLFYVLQGALWRITGVDERTGRLLALTFAGLLAWSLYRLAREHDRTGLAAWLAVALLALSPEFVTLALAGLTDVPVAALVGFTGALALGRHPVSGPRVAAILAAAAAAGLVRSSALPALAGLAAATLVGPRPQLRERLVRRATPVAAGAAVAVGYFFLQARALGIPFMDMVSAGNSGPHSTSSCRGGVCEQVGELAARARFDTLAQQLWLGPWLRPFLVYATAYAALRLLGKRHRVAAGWATPAALALIWAGTLVADGAPGLLVLPAGSLSATLYVIAALALLFGATVSPVAEAPSATYLLRAVIWVLPPFAVWLAFAPFSQRLLSPAWPALLLLVSLVVAPALVGLARRAVPLGVLGVLVILGALALNSRNLDGLGTATGGAYEAWRTLPRVLAAAPDREAARALADPQLGRLLAATAPALRGNAMVLSADGRVPFFAPQRFRRGFPKACSDLDAYDLVVIRTDPVSRSLVPPGRGDPAWWTRCPGARVRVLHEEPGAFAVLGSDRTRAYATLRPQP